MKWQESTKKKQVTVCFHIINGNLKYGAMTTTHPISIYYVMDGTQVFV